MTSTTTLIAELLISGVMALVWVILGLLALLGVGWLDPALIKGWEVPLGTVGLASAYTMGVLVDQAADQSLKRWSERIKKEHSPEGFPSIMHLMIAAGSPRLDSWFDYSRSRIRVCRSAALNFLLTTVMGTLFVLCHPSLVRPHGRLFCSLSITLAGTGLTWLALAGWRWSTLSFYRMHQRGPELVTLAQQRAAPHGETRPTLPSP